MINNPPRKRPNRLSKASWATLYKWQQANAAVDPLGGPPILPPLDRIIEMLDRRATEHAAGRMVNAPAAPVPSTNAAGVGPRGFDDVEEGTWITIPNLGVLKSPAPVLPANTAEIVVTVRPEGSLITATAIILPCTCCGNAKGLFHGYCTHCWFHEGNLCDREPKPCSADERRERREQSNRCS